MTDNRCNNLLMARANVIASPFLLVLGLYSFVLATQQQDVIGVLALAILGVALLGTGISGILWFALKQRRQRGRKA